MSFSYSVGSITQSGTDTDLSGLAGLPDVTTTTANGKSLYQLNNVRLVVNGTLMADPELEELFFDGYGNIMPLHVYTGTLNIGREINIGATVNRFSSGTFARFTRPVDSAYLETCSDLIVDTGGTINWYGGAIFSRRNLAIYGAFNTFSTNCKWINQENGTTQIRQRSSTCNINGFVTRGSALTLIANATQIARWLPYETGDGAQAIGLSSSTPSNTWLELDAFDPRGLSGQAGSFWSLKWCRLVNCITGSDVVVAGNSGDSASNTGLYEFRQELTVNYFDLDGISLDGVKAYMVDTDNGNRLSASQVGTNPDYTTDRTYTGTSASGAITFDTDGGILVATAWRTIGGARDRNNNYDYRCISGDSTDDFVLFSIDYTKAINQASLILKGSETDSRNVFLIPDFAITESTKATVDAYTGYETAQKAYDGAKAYLYDNFDGETQVLIGRVGSQLDLDSGSATAIVYDSTAASKIGYSGTTLTLDHASDYTGGCTGTGTFTISGALGLNGGIFDNSGGVVYDSSETIIANVTHTGAFDFTTAGTYTIDGCELDEVTNSSGGAVILNPINGATVGTNTGPNITINLPTGSIVFSGLIAGSQVVVFETGTQTELFRTDSSSTSENVTPLTAGTYDYTVMKVGYFPIRVTGVVIGTSPVAAQISQLEDRAYVASSGLTYGSTAALTGTEFAVTTATTVQNWYSFWIEAWIAESALTNKSFPLATFGSTSFSLEEDYEFSSGSLQYLSRDGFRYVSSAGAVTASYCAVLSSGVVAGAQPEYYFSIASVIDTINTGDVDQVIQYFGDATHGNFDYADYLEFKVQTNGYREAFFSVTGTYGSLEETLYVIPLPQVAIIGLTLGDPVITGVTVTDDSAAPVSWDAGDGAKDYSITITDTGSNTADDILRYLNYYLSLDATFNGKDPFAWPEMVLKNGDTYETIRGELHLITGDVLCGVRVIDGSGDPHPDFTRFQSDDGTYGVPLVYATGSITNIVAGSRIQIYNVTTDTECCNEVVAGTSYSSQYLDGAEFTAGDVVRLRLTYQSGTTAKLGFTQTTVASASGWSFIANQEDDTVYNTFAIDGSSVSNFAADYVDDEIDLIIGADFYGVDAYAWWVYNLSTELGIRNFFGAVTALDTANIRNNVDTVSIKYDNTTGASYRQLDNIRFFRSDGAYPVKVPTTSGYGLDVVWLGQVYVVETGVSGLTAPESAKLLSLDTDNLDVAVSTRLADADYTAPDNVGIAAVQAKTDNLPADPAATSDITALNNFDPDNDVVAHVTLVDTTTTNTDMRGTDGANTVAPDNASITSIRNQTDLLSFTGTDVNATLDGEEVITDTASREASKADVSNLDAAISTRLADADYTAPDNTSITAIKAKTDNLPVDPAATSDITSLNDFDPANDVVARVTLVDTTTTNTDMRGTDGANTVAPDNAGISANGVAIGALNNLSSAEVKTQADQALVDYDAATAADVSGVDVSADVASIKAKTDNLAFTGTDVHATLSGEEVVTDAASRKASKAKATISLG